MQNKQEKFNIPNLLQKGGDEEVLALKKRIRQSNNFSGLLIVLLVGVVAIVVAYVVNNPGIRFAMVHQKESTQFAESYYKVEEVAQQSAKETVNEWTSRNMVK